MQRIDTAHRLALHDVAATRELEVLAQRALPPHTLMQRAGLALARLAMAIAPHAQHIWLACGPGNNGGDGLEAAMHLQRWGKRAQVSWLGDAAHAPADTLASLARAREAGVTWVDQPPQQVDLCIDALLGIGTQMREPAGRMAEWIHHINRLSVPVLAVDLPTGLQADTGTACQSAVRASHTLSLLTLKPGLFTSQGRDQSGQVWLEDLQCSHVLPASLARQRTSAWLAGPPAAAPRPHASHKGSFGDVVVVGGAAGMTGAALLAGSAALHGGAGRVFVCLLAPAPALPDPTQPELMFRDLTALDLNRKVLACGCGGGADIATLLPGLLALAVPMVLDADALNAIARSTALQDLLCRRSQRQLATILTPHPLEAARLLGLSAAQIQADRLAAAQRLAQQYRCVVVLKGSGTVIAQPDTTPVINPTGNAKLATGGSGDVLTGLLAATLARDEEAFEAACQAVYRHGQVADRWPAHLPLTASQLAQNLPL